MPGKTDTFLRLYGTADLDAVIAVFLASVRQIASRDYSAAQIDAWCRVDRVAWEKAFASRPAWVAVRERMIIGFIDLEVNGHLDRLFVHPDYQGVGVASLLLSTAENVAAEQGLSRIFTQASITARPFFEKRGFQTLVQQQVRLRGQDFTNFRMHKILGEGRAQFIPADERVGGR